MYFGALRGLNDPLSVDNEVFYNFYRTLKRWTTGTVFIVFGPPVRWTPVRMAFPFPPHLTPVR